MTLDVTPAALPYRPLFAERRCARCNYWRGQHLVLNAANDDGMVCPWRGETTFQPLIPSSAADMRRMPR